MFTKTKTVYSETFLDGIEVPSDVYEQLAQKFDNSGSEKNPEDLIYWAFDMFSHKNYRKIWKCHMLQIFEAILALSKAFDEGRLFDIKPCTVLDVSRDIEHLREIVEAYENEPDQIILIIDDDN